MRNKIKWLSKSLIIGLSALSVSAFADDTPKIKVEQVHKDLKNPWDMAFLDNDTMFFTEKCDGLSVATKDGVNKLYGMKGSKGYPAKGEDLFCEGQAGMLGLAIDPNFKKK
jgi:glucose/arabinose dehydrogenase